MAKILIIDDEILLLEVIADFFRRHQLETVLISDPKDIDRTLQLFSFDLIICDVVMPGFDFDSFVRKVGSVEKKTELVVMTGDLDLGKKLEFVFPILYKPFELSRLTQVIQKVLNLQQAEAPL